MSLHDELRAALPFVTLSVRLTTPLTELGDLGSRGAARWAGEAILSTSAAVDDPEDRALWARADVALARREGGPEVLDLVVATYSGLSLDLRSAPAMAQVLGSFVDYAHFLPLLDPACAGGLHENAEAAFPGQGGHLVILDRAELAAGWRGMGGVGRLLAARTLQWLVHDGRLVALKPFPTEFSGKGDDPGLPAAAAQVEHVWASLGFRPWREDIWCVDPRSETFARSVARLEERLGVDPDEDLRTASG